MSETPRLRLEIDKLRLDEEWLDQPTQYYTWAKAVAECQLKFDQAKADLSLTFAELDKQIREDPVKFGVGKLTDAIREATIIQQKVYIDTQKQVDKARYHLGMANAALSALDNRKRALTMLVELWVREYYSDPNPRPVSDQGEEFDKEAIRSRGRRRLEMMAAEQKQEADDDR